MKYRNELKYLVSENELMIIKHRLESFMCIDENAKNGKYRISSVYFDDFDDANFYDVDDGVDLKNKYRIRTYDNNSKLIRLECKHKKGFLNAKQSCRLNKEDVELMLEGGYLRDIALQNEVLQELTYKIMAEKMRPVVIVSYDRIPFVLKGSDVRVTLDMNIVSSTDCKNFFGTFNKRRAILPIGMHLLEVKFDEKLPQYIYDCFSDLNLQQISFSKYYLCRKYNIESII